MRRDERYTAPLQQSTLQNLFLHLYCQHLGEERRGEERGWSCLWAALGLLLSAAPVTVSSKPHSYHQIAYVLAAFPHIFHFHPILVTFIPLTSHFLHRLFWLLFWFAFELSRFLCVGFGGCASLPCVLLAGVSGGAKGIASGRPVTCKVHLNLWRTGPVPHGWQLFREKMLVWLRYAFFFFFFTAAPFPSVDPLCYSSWETKPYFSTDVQTFLCLSALTKSFVWTEMSACGNKLPVSPVSFCCCRRLAV